MFESGIAFNKLFGNLSKIFDLTIDKRAMGLFQDPYHIDSCHISFAFSQQALNLSYV